MRRLTSRIPLAAADYANSDDQTLMNDAILSAVINNRTFLGSTARYEAKNKYNPKAPEWGLQQESKDERLQMRRLWHSQRAGNVLCPWDGSEGGGRKRCTPAERWA